VGDEPGRARRLGRRRFGRGAGRRQAARGRVPLLGRLRRFVRRQEQEGQPGAVQAAEPGGRQLRHSRPERELHRRLRSPHRQRVHLPDARHAEHRSAQRHGGEEDHHPVPALLQHAAERVPAARRPLRGHPPQRVPLAARGGRQPRHDQRGARRAHRLPRRLLPRSPQRHLHGAPQGHRIARWRGGARGRAQRHEEHVLRCRWRPLLDGGDGRQGRQRGALAAAARDRRQPHRDGLPVLLRHDR